LPLSLRGNGGNGSSADASDLATIDGLLDRLDRLLRVPSAPPLADVAPRAVLQWAEEAAAALVTRREGLELVRLVESKLAEASATARSIDSAQERLEAKRHIVEERAAGTYWRRRDAGRRAQRPTQLLVDPEAWSDMKDVAARSGRTVGESVGALVTRCVADRSLELCEIAGGRATFARLVVDDDTWTRFAALCRSKGIPIRRAVGVLVETAVDAKR
jgi:hypothetical protein